MLITSIESRVLHWLGCLFIGRPAALQMDDDFYRVEGDRTMFTRATVTWKVMRERIADDMFRRQLRHRVAILASIASFVVTVLLGGALAAVSAVHDMTETRRAQASAVASEMNSLGLTGTGYDLPRAATCAKELDAINTEAKAPEFATSDRGKFARACVGRGFLVNNGSVFAVSAQAAMADELANLGEFTHSRCADLIPTFQEVLAPRPGPGGPETPRQQAARSFLTRCLREQWLVQSPDGRLLSNTPKPF